MSALGKMLFRLSTWMELKSAEMTEKHGLPPEDPDSLRLRLKKKMEEKREEKR